MSVEAGIEATQQAYRDSYAAALEENYPGKFDKNFLATAPAEQLEKLGEFQIKLAEQETRQFLKDAPYTPKTDAFNQEIANADLDKLTSMAQMYETKHLVDEGYIQVFPVGGGETVALNQFDTSLDDPAYKETRDYYERIMEEGEKVHGHRKVLEATENLFKMNNFVKKAETMAEDREIDRLYEEESSKQQKFTLADGSTVSLSGAQVKTAMGAERIAEIKKSIDQMQYGTPEQREIAKQNQELLDKTISLWQSPKSKEEKRKFALAILTGLVLAPVSGVSALGVLGSTAAGGGFSGALATAMALPGRNHQGRGSRYKEGDY